MKYDIYTVIDQIKYRQRVVISHESVHDRVLPLHLSSYVSKISLFVVLYFHLFWDIY